MYKYVFVSIFVMLSALAGPAQAQQSSWIQIEAKRSLGQAQESARRYARDLQSVNGFALRSGWYAIVLGPYSPQEANEALLQLRATRQIPADSYIVNGSTFRRQFWPVGAAIGTQPAQPQQSDQTDATEEPEVTVQAPPPVPSDETPAEARRSERQLTREERELIQTALKWEGFYTAAIDGAFGPGTRNSMAAWQQSRGHEPTGVLTTLERKTLIDSYNAVLASLGLARYRDDKAGIEIDLPLAMIEFDRYEPPFVHFSEKNDSGVRVLLISQAGDEATLRGLYDIMQTLEIVPLEGPRKFSGRQFTLTGQNARMSSHTFARLSDGQVKGFTLIWPAGDEKRRNLVLAAMQSSFTPLPDSVLPDDFGAGLSDETVDLLAGLAVRRPEFSRSGFFVSADGAVLTSADALQQCERITLDETVRGEIAATDPGAGLALIRPAEAQAPLSIARFRATSPRLNSEIAVSGYSYGGLLGAPTLTFGRLQDLRGLNGEVGLDRLSLNATEADSGGPVVDSTGAVAGMLLPPASGNGKKLPDDVRFSADASAILGFLKSQGLEASVAESTARMAPEDLTALASDMTVLVSCWN
ncbi:MAG TPA: peptidoglycan-binding protein [Rhodobacteraceae bacterium]|nr:peptidoglycan-binding protein [Paracoccaceae bacterium]